jgi:nitronate monooxygenase
VFALTDLDVPIVLAPMAGGAATPALAAAVSGAGGLGFLAAGYRTAEAMHRDVAATRALTSAPFGAILLDRRGAARRSGCAGGVRRDAVRATRRSPV